MCVLRGCPGGCVWERDVCLGMSASGSLCVCVCQPLDLEADTPLPRPRCRHPSPWTNICENIILPQTLRAVNIPNTVNVMYYMLTAKTFPFALLLIIHAEDKIQENTHFRR